MIIDLPEQELHKYRSSQKYPDDFDSFWEESLIESRRYDVGVQLTPVGTGLETMDVFDVCFAGFQSQPVRGWLRVPRSISGPVPAVVQFHGYGSGRGSAIDDLLWASAGYVHLVMDNRGQGSTWSSGETNDPVGSGPHQPGFMTKGIESRETYYYRRLFLDGVRAVDAVRSLEFVDGERVALVGGSQGGGTALAVAGLDSEISAVFAHVPFMCDLPRATLITDNEPYKEIGRYLAVHRSKTQQVHDVLRYFDCVNFSRRATAPAWFSVGLMDPTCPPSTVFGAFNEYKGPKNLKVWPYNGHEGGGPEDLANVVKVLRTVWR